MRTKLSVSFSSSSSSLSAMQCEHQMQFYYCCIGFGNSNPKSSSAHSRKPAEHSARKGLASCSHNPGKLCLANIRVNFRMRSLLTKNDTQQQQKTSGSASNNFLPHQRNCVRVYFGTHFWFHSVCTFRSVRSCSR